MHPYVVGAGAVAALLAISALANAKLAKTAERDDPPKGRFLEVDGVRIHYLDRGEGEPLVLLHGSGSMIQVAADVAQSFLGQHLSQTSSKASRRRWHSGHHKSGPAHRKRDDDAYAYATQSRYKELAMPVIIIAGEEDQLVDIESQSARLHRELPHSVLRRISRTGHMVHQTATAAVMVRSMRLRKRVAIMDRFQLVPVFLK